MCCVEARRRATPTPYPTPARLGAAVAHPSVVGCSIKHSGRNGDGWIGTDEKPVLYLKVVAYYAYSAIKLLAR